jgi:hypothetical protein
MKNLLTFKEFVNESELNEGVSDKTSKIINKIKDVASQLGFSAFTTVDSLKTATKGTALGDVLEPSIKWYTDMIVAYMFVDAWGHHLLVVMPGETNSEEIDIDFYKVNKANVSSSASTDHFYGNEESKTWTFKKTWKDWFTL